MDSDSLDIENHAALQEYLRRRDPALSPIHFQTLAGGVSNRTVRVKFENGDAWVIKQALAKLRTKADWFSDPERVRREALGIRWLNKLVPASVPEFVFEDFEQHLVAMQAVEEPHENWKTMLMAGRIELDHFEQFGKMLGTIHRASAARSEQLAHVFADRRFFESLRIEPYYQYTARQVPEAADFLDRLIADTRNRRLTLVHGDYSPKNFLLHRERLILLDHEVIHWGDPAFDLGFALAHFFAKAAHLAEYRQSFMRAIGTFEAAYLFGAVSGGRAAPCVYQRVADDRFVIRHTIACILARAAGRSPLEYLNEREKRFCVNTMLDFIKNRPESTMELLATAAWMSDLE